MTRTPMVDIHTLGFTDEELETAGRVASAIHAAVMRDYQGCAKKRSVYAKREVAESLLRAGGWRSQRDRAAEWRAWLRNTKRCTMPEAHEARMRLASPAAASSLTSDRSKLQHTRDMIEWLEESGKLRYVRGDRWHPGEIIWTGGNDE